MNSSTKLLNINRSTTQSELLNDPTIARVLADAKGKKLHFSMEDGLLVMSKRFLENERLLARCNEFIEIENSKYDDTFIARLDMTTRDSLWKYINSSFSDYVSENKKELNSTLFSDIKKYYNNRDSAIEKIALERFKRYDELMPHQKQGVIEAYYKKRVLFAYEQGLGKTLMGIAISFLKNCERTLIVCPSIAKYNWLSELTDWGVKHFDISIIETGNKTRITHTSKFIIINYDLLQKWEYALSTMKIDHIILDECHKIKNTESKRNNVIDRIDKVSEPSITLLSGTPASNTIDDLFAYLSLSDHYLGQVYNDFIRRFTDTIYDFKGTKKRVGKNLEFLNACISNFIIRKRKEDALKLPEKIYHKLYFDMGFFKEEYDNAIEEMIRKMEEKGSLNMELNIAQLGVITSKSKVNSIITLAESLSNKMHKVITTEVAMKENNIVEKKEVELEVANKVIIFCPYTEAINKFVEYFGARCVRIDGSVPAVKRTRLAKIFRESRTVNFLIGQTDAAGIAINLVNKESSKNLPPITTVIHAGLPFTNAQLEQANDRVHRMGQYKECEIYYTFAEDSIDEHVFNLVTKKYKDVSTVIDGSPDEVDWNNVKFDEMELFSQAMINSLLNMKENDIVSKVRAEFEARKLQQEEVRSDFKID